MAAFPSLGSNSSTQGPFKLDEGYSEETRSQEGSDILSRPASRSAMQTCRSTSTIPEWVTSMSEAQRMDLAYQVLRTLRGSAISAVIDRLRPLLFQDPVQKFPDEVILNILSRLTLPDLLSAASVSRQWRSRAMDSSLWRRLYWSQGWKSNAAEIRDIMASQNEVKSHRHGKRRLSRDSLESAPIKAEKSGPRAWREQYGNIETDEVLKSKDGDSEMKDVDASQGRDGGSLFGGPSVELTDARDTKASESSESRPVDTAQERVFGPSNEKSASVNAEVHDRRSLTHSPMAVDSKPLPPHSKLLEPAERGQTLNWQFLYKQRKRLENNWTSGRYTCFQLPHPRYPQEAHRECIYTLQYSSKWLVSGSRDKTLRKWDLETKRLVGQPLVGHTGSVLCLQFDESPEEDVLISGSSDTHVIVWRFSTGEVITKLNHAHSESVLNLRFDRRVLVTCSKDKSIKVWNRRALEPTDPFYPQQSKPTQPPAAVFTDYGFKNQPTNLKLKVLLPYTLLLIFRGHSAAVNAIQVYGDEIVSASGDRHVKVWSISQNRCVMAIAAHVKGIACIQFDGRRIVTGSSDNTVRVFDRKSGAEVACLSGHEHLVRTVQAGFGDLAWSEELDQQAAKEIDRKFFEARLAGRVPNPLRVRARNPGSTDPKDIVAFGAKLPPGGGGGGYARIVSGSYDETVIIWKRDEKGKWVIGQRLRQEDAAREALRPYQLYNEESFTTIMSMMRRRQENNQQPGAANTDLTNPDASAAPPSQPVQLHPQLVPTTGASSVAAASSSLAPNQNPTNNQPTTNNTSNALQATTQPTNQNQTTAEIAGEGSALGGTARVFKLQFDARRIICCSQEPRIVGWDFADGDEDIIEASQVFQGIE